ncbi:synaptotagmin-3-like [Panicum miliaceum]|uniref:Synaptotagmin-3-like n=1 Tax=Panicum miliaceum TaxID=4540 RepID=A0A3L6RXQ2_PANMI|nr:synaptotagmin-3-like [Panicum miliaceum]
MAYPIRVSFAQPFILLSPATIGTNATHARSCFTKACEWHLDPVIRPLRDLDSETLQTTIPDIPLWVKSPDYERVDWMNKFIFDMWPFLDKAICNNIKRATRLILDQYVGQYGIESIEFGELTLGALPPTFQGIKVYEMLEKVLVIEPVIRWASIANVIVNAKVHSFKVSVQLEDLHIMLTPRVTLKPLVPSFPCFANLCVSLMEKPRIDFGFKLLGGDIMAIPVLYQYVQDQISKQISVLYHWPKVIQIPILDGESGATKKPVGILHVKVKMHDKLGMQVIPLRLLTPYERKLFTLNLVRSMNPNDPHNKKNRGRQLIVELTFDPFREDNGRSSVALDGEGNASIREGGGESSGGVLLVSVENAEDVEGKQHTNPYAEVFFRGERKKTKVIRKTRDPRWSEEFQFMVDEPPVEDKESLGHVNINLVDVVNNGRINEKYHLINSRNGMIQVEIKWSTV